MDMADIKLQSTVVGKVLNASNMLDVVLLGRTKLLLC